MPEKKENPKHLEPILSPKIFILKKNIETEDKEKSVTYKKKLDKDMLVKIKSNMNNIKELVNQLIGVGKATPVVVSSQTEKDFSINKVGFNRICVSPPLITLEKSKSREYASNRILNITKHKIHANFLNLRFKFIFCAFQRFLWLKTARMSSKALFLLLIKI